MKNPAAVYPLNLHAVMMRLRPDQPTAAAVLRARVDLERALTDYAHKHGWAVVRIRIAGHLSESGLLAGLMEGAVVPTALRDEIENDLRMVT